jgi:Bacterial SH3 domain
MAQSSFVRTTLPACVLSLVWVLGIAPPLARAQTRYRTTRPENFRQQPGPDQKLLGSVYPGTEFTAGDTQDGWVDATLNGWIWAQSVSTTARDSFDLVVSAHAGENLRAAPNGAVMARLANGFLLHEVQRQGGWVQVRRTGWIWAKALERVADSDTTAASAGPAAAAAPPAATGDEPATTGAGGATAASLDYALTAHATDVRRVPDGDVSGSLAEGAPVRVLARSGDWVRVATEGWVRESDLKPAAPGVLVGVSGAEVRARPAEFEGKVVQWTVQFISLQTADELRREIPKGQRYMLARGPLPESGFLYVILTPDQATRIAALQPLAELVIVGKIKVARSHYLGNPVVELMDLSVREP